MPSHPVARDQAPGTFSLVHSSLHAEKSGLLRRPVRAKSSSGGMRSPAGRLRRRAAVEPGHSRHERLAALPDEKSGFGASCEA
jgi:hypothetical protein